MRLRIAPLIGEFSASCLQANERAEGLLRRAQALASAFDLRDILERQPRPAFRRGRADRQCRVSPGDVAIGSISGGPHVVRPRRAPSAPRSRGLWCARSRTRSKPARPRRARGWLHPADLYRVQASAVAGAAATGPEGDGLVRDKEEDRRMTAIAERNSEKSPPVARCGRRHAACVTRIEAAAGALRRRAEELRRRDPGGEGPQPRHPARRVPDDARAVRLGQDHLPDDARRLRDRRPTARSSSTAGRSTTSRRTSAASAWCSRTTRCSRT